MDGDQGKTRGAALDDAGWVSRRQQEAIVKVRVLPVEA
jgi:hypothetical protein